MILEFASVTIVYRRGNPAARSDRAHLRPAEQFNVVAPPKVTPAHSLEPPRDNQMPTGDPVFVSDLAAHQLREISRCQGANCVAQILANGTAAISNSAWQSRR